MGLRQTYLACTASDGGYTAKALRNKTFNHFFDISSVSLAAGLFSKTENNRFENNWLVSWGGSDISAGGGTKKGRMKGRRTVAKRAISYFFVSFNYTADFGSFKYQVAGLPAVA